MRYGARLFAGTFFSCFVLSGVGAVTPPAADTSLPATAKSWVDLSRYSGKENSLPVTRADFRQLVYELQDHIGASGGTARLSAAQRHPYDAVAKPGNNLGERVPLTVVHWFRSVEVAADEQRRQSLQAGAAAATDVSNVTVFAFSPLRPKTYRGCFLLFTLDQDAFSRSWARPHRR